MLKQAMFVVMLMSLQTSSGAQDRREALAAMGKLQDDAPVKAAAEITIHAAPEKVWNILSGVADWPRWQLALSAADLHGPLAAGTVFTWKNGGTKITSRLALIEPGRRIAWTGTAMGAHAIHFWTLEPAADGGTLMRTKESMDGFVLARFYTFEDLRKSLTSWLETLKSKAEK